MLNRRQRDQKQHITIVIAIVKHVDMTASPIIITVLKE